MLIHNVGQRLPRSRFSIKVEGMKTPAHVPGLVVALVAFMAFLFGGLGATTAQAGSSYKDIAQFTEGKVATLSMLVEYKPDGGRSINVRIQRPPHGATLFFHAKEWALFCSNLEKAKAAPDGVEQTFDDIETPGGSLLRLSSVRRGQEIQLTLTRQPSKGDSYPPVPFHLQATDFDRFLKAVSDAAKAIDKK